MHICFRRKNQDISKNTTARCCKTGWEHFECGVLVICGYIYGMLICGYPRVWRPVGYSGCSLVPSLSLRQALYETGPSTWLGISWQAKLADQTNSMDPSAYASSGVEIRACHTMPSNFQMHSGAVLRPPCLYRSTLPTEVCFLLWSIYILRQDIAMWPRLTDCDPPASTSHHWTVSASLCLSKVLKVYYLPQED